MSIERMCHLWPANLSLAALGLASWRRAGMVLALGCQVALLLLTSASSAPAWAAPEVWACPMLLMEFECLQYQRRLTRAENVDERCRIEREYQEIVQERRRLCPCAEARDLQDAAMSSR